MDRGKGRGCRTYHKNEKEYARDDTHGSPQCVRLKRAGACAEEIAHHAEGGDGGELEEENDGCGVVLDGCFQGAHVAIALGVPLQPLSKDMARGEEAEP